MAPIVSLRLRALVLLLAGAVAAPALAQSSLQFRVPLQGLVVVPSAENPGEPGDPGDEPGEAPGTIVTGEFGPMSGYTGAFGTVGLTRTASKRFIFRNTGNAPATVYSVLQTQSGEGLSLGENGCGTQAAPATVAAGYSCQVVVHYSPMVEAPVAGAIAIQGNVVPALEPVALSGQGSGTFDPTGRWSSVVRNYTAPANPTTLAALTAGSTETRTVGFYMQNTGLGGPLSASFKLSGDTEHFRITQVYKARSTVSFDEQPNYASCGAEVVDAISTSPCRADAPVTGDGTHRPQLFVRIVYEPLAIGSHSVTLSAETDNGTALPAPIVINGSSVFNAQGQWFASLTSGSSVTQTSAGTMTFGDGTKLFVAYLRNLGNHGSISAGFELQDETGAFRLVSVRRARYSGTYGDQENVCEAEVSDDYATACTTNIDYPHLRVVLEYNGNVSKGVHTATLVPIAANAAPMPGPLTLRGESLFTASGEWWSGVTGLFTNRISSRNVGTFAVGSSTSTRFALRKMGTYGLLNVGFRLEGDVEHFRLAAVRRGGVASGNIAYANCDSVVSGVTASACQTTSGYPDIDIQVFYEPKAAGTHNVQVVPLSQNPAVMPTALPLSGTAN